VLASILSNWAKNFGCDSEMRGDLVGFLHRDKVVFVLDIALFHRRQRGGGQRGLELQHVVGLLFGVGFGHAGQLQRLGDVGHVRIADVLVFRLGVVVLGRQAQARLVGEADLRVGVLEVAACAELEHLHIAVGVALGNEVGHVSATLQAGNRIELRFDRIKAVLLDGRLIHAGVIKPADFLLDRAGLGAVGILGGVIDNLVLGLQALLIENVEGAPAALIGRNRIGGDPLGVDEAVEVRAGLEAGIEFADVEDAGRSRCRCRRRCGACAWSRCCGGGRRSRRSRRSGLLVALAASGQ
jgi:hypothetical protein